MITVKKKLGTTLTQLTSKAYLEAAEIDNLSKAATNLRDQLLIRLLFHLGCRVSEALAITLEDIDIRQGKVVIQHLKLRLKLSCSSCGASLGKSHSFCPRCGAKVGQAVAKEQEHRKIRTLPLDSNTLQMLQSYIKRGGPVKKNGRFFVFGINRHRAWQVVTECARRAGLPQLVNPETGRVHNISPHRLRDAFAISCYKAVVKTFRG